MSKTKIIAIGDPHFQTTNVPEVTLFVQNLTKLISETNPDLIVVLGDLLHTHERLHTVPLNMAIEFIEKLSKLAPTIVLVGNHDMCNNQQFLSKQHWMNSLKYIPNVEVADTVIERIIKNEIFIFCPYVPPGRFQEALNTNKNWKKSKCIFAHQEFYGCKMGAISSTDGDKWPEDFPYVVSGHIHSRQQLQKNVYYCGASMQHAFGESEKNIIPILSFGKKDYPKIEEIDLNLPRKKIVYSSIDNIEDVKLPTNTKDQIKLTVSGNYEEFKAFRKTKKYKEILTTGTKVVFKPKTLEKEELKEKREKNIEELASSEINFNTIIYTLVLQQKNKYLLQAHELILNGKELDEEDFLFP